MTSVEPVKILVLYCVLRVSTHKNTVTLTSFTLLELIWYERLNAKGVLTISVPGVQVYYTVVMSSFLDKTTY